jgi:hypothetical protein
MKPNLFGMTTEEHECLEECIALHIHAFNTCAEVGVIPVLDAFILNTFESCEEYEQHPSLYAARRYIKSQWDSIIKAATQDHA